MSTKTEVIVILDRSGFMAGLEPGILGGYNGFLEKQKILEGETQISTVLFELKTALSLYN